MYFWRTMTKVLMMVMAPLVLIITIQILAPQFATERELRKTRDAMLRENEVLSRKTSILHEKISRFQSDPEFVVRTAHEIGMARENEIVFSFEDSDPGRE